MPPAGRFADLIVCPGSTAALAAFPSAGAFASARPSGVTLSISCGDDWAIGLAFDAESCRGCGAGCGAGDVDLRTTACDALSEAVITGGALVTVAGVSTDFADLIVADVETFSVLLEAEGGEDEAVDGGIAEGILNSGGFVFGNVRYN